MEQSEKLYLGVDFSTQQGKIIVVNEHLTPVYDDHVSFDKDLPEFGTEGGVHYHDNKLEVTVPSAMFIKTLDVMLERMVARGFLFGKVVALSGDAQQCGSVYWKHGSRDKLKNFNADKTLYEQLKDSFSIPDPPNWMDSTTTKQCRQLEKAVGGPMELARITGARAFEHDTGTEIMKIFQTQKEAYDQTERISMISSQFASLLLGDYAPIDFGDGSVMGLLDIRTKQWNPKCLDACGDDHLVEKLGEPHPSHEILGNISPYFVQKYGFPVDCKITPFTGDNLQSLIGLAVKKDELIISMGTADCLFLWSAKSTPNLFGHVLVSALDPDTFLTLIPFKNGSLQRQHIMESRAGSWEKFSQMLKATPPGNKGKIGMYFDVMEIVPAVMGRFKFGKDDEKVETFTPEEEVRAVLEGQFLCRRMYAEMAGLQLGPDTKIIATGGASANKDLLQIIADIFNTPVYTIDVPNSAALGGCYRAKLVVEGSSTLDALKGLSKPICAATPTTGVDKLYNEMLERYKKLEQQVVAEYEVQLAE